MLAAAFETSTRSPSVALAWPGGVVEEALAGERPHASDLLPALDRLLARAGRSVRELELIALGTGPGSFTGLRVAAATALGLSRGGCARLVGVPSGEALCWRELEPGRRAAVVLDARQGELYLARYARTAEGVEVLRAPCVVRAAELPAELADPELRVFAEPALAGASFAADLGTRLVLDRVPRASAVLELGRSRFEREGEHALERLEPLYLRAFGARAKAR